MMFRVFLFWAFVPVLFSLVPVSVGAQETGITKSIRQLVGEDYLYSIDFLFFSRLAEGELRLSETNQPNIYRAELVGRTLGIASWLTGNRTQTYTSVMELRTDGSLRSVEHVAQIVKRKWGKWKNRVRRHRYDYEQGTVLEEKFKEDVFHSRKERDIPEGQQPVDMLTAFYNLRSGVYGPLVRGAQFLIPTFSGKGFVDIEINVLTAEQQAKQNYFPAHGLLISANVDPEIFETGDGGLYFWLNAEGVPERGIVEDVIGMGDVRGSLDMEDL